MDKITALKKTIYNLENDVYVYNWEKVESCNCGLLAKTILGGKSIWDAGFADAPHYSDRTLNAFGERAHCMVTGVKLPEVFKSLQDAGFSFKEIIELEGCLNEKILLRMGCLKDKTTAVHTDGRVYNLNRKEKPYLITYLKTWVEIIEEENQGREVERSVATEAKSELLRPEPKSTFKEVTFSKIKENIPAQSVN